jgi:hypothetical protein
VRGGDVHAGRISLVREVLVDEVADLPEEIFIHKVILCRCE